MLILKVRRGWSAFIALVCVASFAFAIVSLVSPNSAHGGLLLEGFGHDGDPMTTADLASYGATGTTPNYTWAADDAAIVTAENMVVPFHDFETDPQMARLGLTGGSNDGKLKQRVNELGSSSLGGNVPDSAIDDGNVRGLFTVRFNQAEGVPAGAEATITLQFLGDDVNNTVVPSPVGPPVSLTQVVGNGDPSVWTFIELLDVAVPVGARGYEAIIEYNISTLGNPSGPIYVDKTRTDFSVIPEPASLLLALCGMSLILGGRKFRS